MQAYLDQMQNFVLAIRGLPSSVAGGEDGRHAVAACLAMLDSSAVFEDRLDEVQVQLAAEEEG